MKWDLQSKVGIAMLASATDLTASEGANPVAHDVLENIAIPTSFCKSHCIRAEGEKKHFSTYAINRKQPLFKRHFSEKLTVAASYPTQSGRLRAIARPACLPAGEKRALLEYVKTL